MRKEVIQLVAGVAMLAGLGGMVWEHKHNQTVMCEAPENMVSIDEHHAIERIVESYGMKYPESKLMATSIVDAASKEGVPSTLVVAIIQVESTFNSKAKSKKKAYGYMQVKPKWWEGETPFNLKDKYENVYAGVWVLSHYADKTGSLDDAVKAYNVGLTSHLKGEEKEAANRYYTKVAAEFKKVEAMFNNLKGV